MTVTQLVNPDIDRVDAVNGPATGLPFLMFKSLDAPQEASAEAPAEEVAKSEDEAPAPAEVEEVAKSEDEAPAEEVAKSEDEAPAASTEEESFKTWKAQSEGEAPAEETAEVAKAAEETPAVEVEKAAVGAGHLPSGLQEILDTFVESYVRYKEAQASGAAAAVAAEESVEDALKPPVASADIPQVPAAQDQPHEEPPAPAEEPPAPAEAPEAPAEAPAEKPAEAAPAAPEAADQPNTPEAPPAAAEAPAEAEEDPEKKFPKKIAKSMDDLIAEAVAKALETEVKKAVEAAQEPLLKKIDVLERTPVDSGPMFAGQLPGNAGNPLLGRGQAEGAPAQGLVNKSAESQAAPGAYALAEALKGVHQGK